MALTFSSSPSRKESGLTLVELLIALALLGFVLLGIAPLFIASMKSNYSANEYTSIHVLARDRLEQLMNLPFSDPQLSVGVKINDQAPRLADPKTGVPPAAGGVANPFQVTYQVLQYRLPDTATPAAGAPFTPTRVVVAGARYDYKRIDVTVTSGTGPLGIGSRLARVTGFLGNPAPGDLSPGGFPSAADGCAIGAAAPCP